ncbi:MAG: anthranilate phosphoribosyltransferase [Candidatus Roizmanbacteria bacterium]
MDLVAIISSIIQKKSLSEFEAFHLMDAMLNSKITPIQIASILTALRMKGETSEEIAGFIQSLRFHMRSIMSENGAVDTCGTGGDGQNTFNISTVVAFVVAGAGVQVAKHGNRAASSKCGSADVLEGLGVNIDTSPEDARGILRKIGVVFLFAPIYHPGLRPLALIRKELGFRTVFNFLGPFLNPAKVRRQVIGVSNIEIVKKVASVAKKLSYEHICIFSSVDGLDEISLSAPTYVYELKDGEERSYFINYEEFGFEKASISEVAGGDLNKNVEIIKNILNGEKGARRNIVLLNSAFALYTSGIVSSVKEALPLVEKSIDSGSAFAKLQEYITISNTYEKYT